jgi:hypothetical protein
MPANVGASPTVITLTARIGSSGGAGLEQPTSAAAIVNPTPNPRTTDGTNFMAKLSKKHTVKVKFAEPKLLILGFEG